MSLPDAWVDSLFARIAVRYGADWVRKWEGVDIGAVKADWARELSVLQLHPDALAYGLDHMPLDRPPNVAQFLALCIARPTKQKALPEPPTDPAIAAAAVAALKRPAGADPKAWAHEMKRKEAAGVLLTSAQRAMWRAALCEAA